MLVTPAARFSLSQRGARRPAAVRRRRPSVDPPAVRRLARILRAPHRRRLTREMKPIKNALRKLLEHAGNGSKRHRLHRRFANNLLKLWPALWTFITVPGVTPTNNAAERAL